MFKGKKVKLRAYDEKDTKIVWQLINNESIRETLCAEGIFPYSYESEKNFINHAMNCNNELFNFAIEDLESRELVGGCGINSVDRKNSVASIGIWIGKKYQNKGFGSDSMRILCKFIFEELNFNKIKLNVYEFNNSGRRCYEAVGFIQEGVLREELFRYGKYNNVISMGLFRTELK